MAIDVSALSKLVSPIFILGCPRSGNTLLGAILNKHPDLLILFETEIFSALYRIWAYRCKTTEGTPEGHFTGVIAEGLSRYNNPLRISNHEILRYANSGAPHWDRMLDAYMRLLIARAKPTAKGWGDKTPHHLMNIAQIVQHYPNAKFVYTQRDPRNVVSSLSKRNFPYTTNRPFINAEVVRHYLSV